MSTTIDQKVVEMKFDNRQFEANVKESMSTLSKLKQSLNLSGAAKGLEEVNAAAKGVDMRGLSGAIDTVQAKFSALQVIGVTTLANIANQAVNTGKRMISALTIDPVKTGFQEYETQINSVQTILANTQNKGSTIKDVNAALNELNKYADLTIYNFTEMTRNIGTFTAAGIDLKTSVSAIQGIANLAAVSGSTSQQASTAMYQLSQALASGTVKLMDWNSVVNAGMGGEVFQTALKKTSELLGTGAEAAIKAKGSFRESLQTGWLTSEVLTETLKKFTTSGANEYVAEYTGLTEKAVEAELKSAKAKYGEAKAVDYASKALAKKSGKNESEIREALKMAETATDAATKVKTFSQLWDVMKEAAQSGWSQTWQLIIGDFEEAKSLLTPLADFFTNAIGKMSDARNNLLKGALNNPFSKFAKKLEKITGPAEKAAKATKKITEATKDYAAIVNKVIGGEFGNGESRIKKLTEAGYDWAKVQNMVNEKLGISVRHAEKAVEADKNLSKSSDKVKESKSATLEQILKMSDAQLKSVGFTKDEIGAFRELEKQSEKTGIPIEKLIENVNQLDGRTLLIKSVKNIGKSIVKVFTAMSKAWKKVFPPMQSEQLYDIIAGFHKLTTYLAINKDTADNLYRTFRGVFSILKIATTLVGGPLKIAFKIFTSILGALHIDVLEFTANIGDAIYNFSKWLDKTLDLTALMKKLIPFIASAAAYTSKWFKSLGEIPIIKKAIESIREYFSILKDMDLVDIGTYLIEGLRKGISDGLSSAVKAIVEVGKMIIEGIKKVLGIHSPSKVMMAIGGFIVAGLALGITKASPEVQDALAKLFTSIFGGLKSIIDSFKDITWGNLISLGGLIATVGILKKISEALDIISGPIKGINGILSGVKTVLISASKYLEGKRVKDISEAIKNLAISLSILTGSVIALAKVAQDSDSSKSLWTAIGMITALSVALGILAFATEKIAAASVSINGNGVKVNGLKSSLLAIATAVLAMAIAVKAIGQLDPKQAEQGFMYLTGTISAMIIFMYTCGKAITGDNEKTVKRFGGMMIKMAYAMVLMVGVMKLVGMLKPEEIVDGVVFAIGFIAFVKYLGLIVTTTNGSLKGLGSSLIGITIAMGLMVGVVKLASQLTQDELTGSLYFIGGFITFVLAMAMISKIGGITKMGATLAGISFSMLLMVGVVKLASKLSTDELIKAGKFALGFITFVLALTLISQIGGIDKMGTTIFAVSVAVGILAGIAVVLGMIPVENLIKGVTAVSVLGAIMALMIWATRGANECKGNIIAMTAAIAVMAIAVAALSMLGSKKLAISTACLGVLMGMFALMEKMGSKAEKSVPSILVMTLAVAALGGMLYLVGQLPAEQTIGAATALGIAMLAFGASMGIISKFGEMSKMALISVGVMTLVVGAIGGILYLVGQLPAAQSIAASAALSIVLVSLAVSMGIINKFGNIMPTTLIAVGVMTLVIGALAGILYLVGQLPVKQTLASATALESLLVVMTGICVVMSLIPAAAAIQGAIGFGSFVAIIAGILAALGGLSKIPGVNDLISSGGDLLSKIGFAIGNFVGSIIGGFGAGISTGLPKIASNLSQFIVNLTPFLVGIKMVNQSTLSSVGYLSAAIIALTVAEFVNGIMALMGGGFMPSLPKLGTMLSNFMINAMPFMIAISTLNSDSAEAAKALADVILAITASNVISGITSFIGGTKSMEKFGAQLTAFGDAIASFSSTVSGKIDAEAVQAAAKAGAVMVEFNKTLPRTSGLLQFFTGEKDMKLFGDRLAAFGTAIVSFSDAVSAKGAINETAIKSASNAGAIMVEFNKTLPRTGGVIQFFTGEKDMALFGYQLTAFGTAIVSFSDTVSAKGAINENAITAAANAGKIMSEMQSSVVPVGGVITFFTGSKDLIAFGTQIALFGKAIAKFSEEVIDIDSTSVTAAINAGKLMAEIQNALPDKKLFGNKMDISDFGSKIKGFGKYIKKFSKEVSGIDQQAMNVSIDAARRLVDFIKSTANLDTTGVKAFKDAIASLGTTDINNFVSAVSNSKVQMMTAGSGLAQAIIDGISTKKANISTALKSLITNIQNAIRSNTVSLRSSGARMLDGLITGMRSKAMSSKNEMSKVISAMLNSVSSNYSRFIQSGSNLMAKFANGLERNKIKVKLAFSTSMQSTIIVIKGYYNRFFESGKYLVEGFADGINAKTFEAKAKARAMAQASLDAARKTLDEHSPSKKMYKIGAFAGEGFVNALGDFVSTSYKAGVNMADSARKGLSNAIEKSRSLASFDMDMQPTIRPVVDLSAVEAGAGMIDGMFSGSVSIGSKANVSAISSMMKARSQNGNNDDVVSAISGLRKDIGKIQGNTYNVGGITYDDGSNISNAVESLVRAARIERRV